MIAVDALPERERELAQRWINHFEAGKDRHEVTRKRAESHYGLYRSYKEVKRTYDSASRRDVDSVLEDLRAGFGADLFIPYVFSVIETTLARMLAQNPTMKVKPAPTYGGVEELMKADRNSGHHAVLLEKQLSQTDFHLALQDVGKEGLMTGIGIGKSRWLSKVVDGRKMLVPPTYREEGGPEWVIGKSPGKHLIYEGPVFEWVSLYDWIHDPRGHDMKSVRWVIHRMWFDDDEVARRVKDGTWQLPEGVTLEEVLASSSAEKRSEIRSERDAISGFSNSQDQNEKMHEVWECWDGDTVTTMVNRCCPVQHGANPFWHGEIPFHIFRPTRVPGEMMGIGEAEAIEDLQREMNIMRKQRRDNAAFVLQRPFAYFDGMVDMDDFKWAAGSGLAVDGDPTNLLNFFPVQDIPHSSYQEEANLQRDIERVTGIDDTGSGVLTGQGTATEAQIVQQMAGVRIANKTKLLELELVKPACRHHLWLNQQKLVEKQFMVGPPDENDEEAVRRGWSPYEMGPETLAGNFDPEPDAGSMQPDNNVEKLDRAERFWTAFGDDPYIDEVAKREYVLTNMGIPNPRSIIRPPEDQIAQDEMMMAAEQMAVQLGIDPAAAQQLLQEGVQQAKQLKQMEEQAAAGQPPALAGTVEP